MKKKIISLLLATVLMLSFFTVSAFATAGTAEAFEEAYEEGFEMVEEYAQSGDIYGMLQAMYGENYGELVGITIACSVCMLLSFPVFVVMIVFIVLNVKTNKKLKEYKAICQSGVPYTPFATANNAPTGVFSGISNNAPAVQGNIEQGGQQ